MVVLPVAVMLPLVSVFAAIPTPFGAVSPTPTVKLQPSWSCSPVAQVAPDRCAVKVQLQLRGAGDVDRPSKVTVAVTVSLIA